MSSAGIKDRHLREAIAIELRDIDYGLYRPDLDETLKAVDDLGIVEKIKQAYERDRDAER